MCIFTNFNQDFYPLGAMGIDLKLVSLQRGHFYLTNDVWRCLIRALRNCPRGIGTRVFSGPSPLRTKQQSQPPFLRTNRLSCTTPLWTNFVKFCQILGKSFHQNFFRLVKTLFIHDYTSCVI